MLFCKRENDMKNDILIDYKKAEIFITVNGKINEDTLFPTIKFSKNSTVVFDLENLTLLNSCGIRGWIYWLKSFSKEVTSVIFRKCNRIFIEQVNLIDGLVPDGGIIESFQAPYYCESCDVIDTRLIDCQSLLQVTSEDSTLSVPVKLCTKCGTVMELDIIEKKYLKFFKKFCTI